MLRDAEDVQILISPNLSVAWDCDDLTSVEESVVSNGFENANAIFDIGDVLEDLNGTPTDNRIGGLMNFEMKFRSYHLRKLRPFASRIHHGIHSGKRHVL